MAFFLKVSLNVSFSSLSNYGLDSTRLLPFLFLSFSFRLALFHLCFDCDDSNCVLPPLFLGALTYPQNIEEIFVLLLIVETFTRENYCAEVDIVLGAFCL